MKGKAISIILVPKAGGEEIIFSSLTEASEFLGINKMKLSRILKGKGNNDTEYFVTPSL